MLPPELARYRRQMILPGVGEEGQRTLQKARVLMVGAGGLGSPALLYLAAAGVGTLGIADFDTVTEHNLQRQILFDTPSAGKAKSLAARERLLALNPAVEIHLHPEGFTPDNALTLCGNYDILIDGSDNFGTRFLTNDAAYISGIPLVYGSILRFEGQYALFHPNAGGPCYRCLFPQPPQPGTVPNCAEAGVFGALAGVIGSLQALGTLKWLLGLDEPYSRHLTVYRALENRFVSLQMKKDPDCPLCSKEPDPSLLQAEETAFTCGVGTTGPREELPLEISVREADEALRQNPADWIILDVREPVEWDIVHLPEAGLIPMGEIPEKWSTLPTDKKILIHCHHGMRSLHVTQFLRAKGLDQTTNLAGGIDAWAREIDPSLARY